MSEDVSVRIDVLANDHHFTEPIDSSTLHVVAEASHGQTLIKLPSATIVYKPNANFFGLDSFTYQVCNAEQHCQEALVQIMVHAINDAPVAQNDLDTVYEDSWIRLDVIGNDSDLADNIRMENTPVKVVEMPRQGALTVDQEGLMYRPNANYYGNDYFRYSICDESLCDTAMVRIHVKSVNDPPKVQDDFATTSQGLLLVIDPLTNDDDSLDLLILDRSTLSADGFQPKHGFIYLDQEVALIVYVPNDDFVGLDSFQYRVCDLGPENILCDWATIFVEVSPVIVGNANPFVESGNKPSMETITVEKEDQNMLPLENSLKDELREYLKEHTITPGQYRYLISKNEIELIPLQGS